MKLFTNYHMESSWIPAMDCCKTCCSLVPPVSLLLNIPLRNMLSRPSFVMKLQLQLPDQLKPSFIACLLSLKLSPSLKKKKEKGKKTTCLLHGDLPMGVL